MRGRNSTGAVASRDVGMCKGTKADAGVCVQLHLNQLECCGKVHLFQ